MGKSKSTAAPAAAPLSSSTALRDLSDSQIGPLAEALAIADVLEIVAVDNLGFRDNTFATLSHMLVDRLDEVRAAIEQNGVSHG